jgi:YggT family protein
VCTACLLIVYLEAFINVLYLALTLSIFGRVILSWVPTRLPWGLNEFLFSVTEPILGPIRRALPLAGGFDLSPLIALVGLQLAEQLLLRLLPPPV